MKVTLTASTGVQIAVWREQDMFAAQRADATHDAQICLGVDLFEVLAELANLNLENRADAGEAIELAAEAQRRLAAWPGAPRTRTDSSEL
jgi:hypothetical protein